MSKRFAIVTPHVEIAALYTQGFLEPTGEEARVLYTAVQKLHELVPMERLTFRELDDHKGTYRYAAVAKNGLRWRQDIYLPGGPDKDPPMSYGCSPWRPSERVPVCAVRDALLAVRNRHGLESFEATFHG